jgi:hypothetical protein
MIKLALKYIKFPQVFAVFSAQSSSTSDNNDDLNNEPATSEMSRVEQTYHHKNRNLKWRFAKTSDDSTNSYGTNFDKHSQINTNKFTTSNYLNIFVNFTCNNQRLIDH